jgi:hypothetical protein
MIPTRSKDIISATTTFDVRSLLSDIKNQLDMLNPWPARCTSTRERVAFYDDPEPDVIRHVVKDVAAVDFSVLVKPLL